MRAARRPVLFHYSYEMSLQQVSRGQSWLVSAFSVKAEKPQCVDPHVHTHQQHICLTKTSQWDIRLGSKHLSHFCR